MKFAKFVSTPFSQNSTVRLLLIIAVSIVVKGELANETVIYDTKTKAYIPISAEVLVIKKAVQVKEQVSEAVVHKKTYVLEFLLKRDFNTGVFL